MADLVEKLARLARDVGRSREARRVGNSQAEPCLPSSTELRSSETTRAGAMMRSAKKWRALGDIGDAYRTRQFVDNQFVDGSSADPSSTKPRWLIWSYGTSRSHWEKWRAQVHSGRSRTERATPLLGFSPAEPGSPRGRSLITGCAVLARKNRQRLTLGPLTVPRARLPGDNAASDLTDSCAMRSVPGAATEAAAPLRREAPMLEPQEKWRAQDPLGREIDRARHAPLSGYSPAGPKQTNRIGVNALLKVKRWRVFPCEDPQTRHLIDTEALIRPICPIGPEPPTHWLISGYLARPRKNRQSGLNSRWRLKASSCLKEGRHSRQADLVPLSQVAPNARDRAVPRRDKGSIRMSRGRGLQNASLPAEHRPRTTLTLIRNITRARETSRRNGMTQRRPWQHRRESPSARGYGAEHRRIRTQLLKEEPLCQECKRKGRVTVATIADHIVPLSKGGKTERSNYQALCRECSDRKTLADAGKRFRRRIGLDGWPED